MKKGWLRKVVVCGIILSFIGTSAVCCMGEVNKKSDKTLSLPLDDGLEAFWSFNNPNNPGYDDSGNNHQGTVNGATWIPNGIKKGAMSFNGDDLISLSEFTSSDSQGTVVAWVKQSLPDEQSGFIYAESTHNSNSKPYISLGFNGSELYFRRDVQGGSTNYQGKVDVGANDGKWHFVAYLSDGTENRFYFDAREVFPIWQDNTVPHGIWFDDQVTSTHSIGTIDSPDNWGWYTGVIDDVRIYNRALSEEEILALSNILEYKIQGGLGANLVIKNNGTTNANNVDWQISVKGGILGRIDFTQIGTVDLIEPGQSKQVGTRMFFGLGSIQITITVREDTATMDGTQLFILTMVKK
jgi:hypothetical protein